MMVRFFCVVGPTGLPIADTGHAFLRALVDQHIKVRALPIGAAGGFVTERRWYLLGSAFTQMMSIPYVNVVCANANTPMGDRAAASTFSKSDDLPPELKAALGPMADSKSADVEYVPQTVFGGLFTVGVPNVAIVSDLPSEAELYVLGRYDLVLATDSAVWDYLNKHGVVARYVTPPGLVAIGWPKCRFVRVLEEVIGCEFATTAITEPPAATAAPRVTTSLPSRAIRTRKSSSKSRSLARGLQARRVATDTLTISRSRTRWLRVLATLKSFMRSLAFWRG